jgi:membrane-bound serine protease (ClpP class)
MRTMTQRMLVARVPVVLYVAPSGARAASAGVFLALAANVAAMAPGTNIGAAHPVAAGGGALDPTMAAKMANDAAATARALAAQRGRNADWADRAVRESVSATESEALADGVVDLVARDLGDLLGQLDGRSVVTADGARTIAVRGAPTVAVEMTVVELVLHTLLNPNVAFLLLNLGFLGLIAELYHPGTLVPGLVGAIGLVMGLVALGTLPVNWAAVGLLLLAFGLFLADLHLSGHGALSVGGLIAFVLGGLLLFSPVDLPPWGEGGAAASPWRVNPWLLAGTALLSAGYIGLILRAALGTRRLGPGRAPAPGAGDMAVALTDLAPSGVVRLGHEDWSATSQSGDLAAGEPVEVPTAPSFVDGIGAPIVFPDMFEAVRELIEGSIVVSVESVARALRVLAERARVVAEGAGASSVAAAQTGRAGEGKVVCVVSGGNIDPSKVAAALRGEVPEPSKARKI